MMVFTESSAGIYQPRSVTPSPDSELGGFSGQPVICGRIGLIGWPPCQQVIRAEPGERGDEEYWDGEEQED